MVSFFGSRQVPLVLSPEFHYRRQRMTSSQVRKIGSGLQPRWTLERRMQVVLRLLADEAVSAPLSHVVPFERAPEAYELLDTRPEEAMGVLIDYRAGEQR